MRKDAPAADLLKRLQVPLLRVALQDRAFFIRPQHPARQLLNAVAESGARWLDKDDIDPQMLGPLQQAVNHVVENFDGTLELVHWAPAHETQGRGHVASTVTA